MGALAQVEFVKQAGHDERRVLTEPVGIPLPERLVTDRRSLDRALLAADRHPTPMLDVVRAMSSSGPIDLSVLHRSREVAVVVADPHERPDWRTELDRALDVAPLTADVSVWIAGAGPSVVELLGAPS